VKSLGGEGWSRGVWVTPQFGINLGGRSGGGSVDHGISRGIPK